MICSFQKPNSSSEITPTITYETTVSRSVGSRLSFIKEMAKSTPCGHNHRTPCGFSPHLTIAHSITCTTYVQHLAHRIGYPPVAQTSVCGVPSVIPDSACDPRSVGTPQTGVRATKPQDGFRNRSSS